MIPTRGTRRRGASLDLKVVAIVAVLPDAAIQAILLGAVVLLTLLEEPALARRIMRFLPPGAKRSRVQGCMTRSGVFLLDHRSSRVTEINAQTVL